MDYLQIFKGKVVFHSDFVVYTENSFLIVLKKK